MKKLSLIFIALILAIIAVSQPSTLIEYPYVVKHMSNQDQIFTATVGKYFVGYSPISQGDSVLYYSTSGLPTGLGTYGSPLPIDSINTLKSNGKKVLARIKRGDTYGTITLADSNIVVCSYSTINTTAKPIINYIDYNGKANIEVKNIDQTYDGYYFVSNSGNDLYSGAEPDSAWATIAKVNETTFEPGDRIVFKRDGVWRESLTVRASGTAGNTITFGAYGIGANPVINGANVITGFTEESTNLWKKTKATEITDSVSVLSGWDFEDNWTTIIAGSVINDQNTFTTTQGGGIAKTVLFYGKTYRLTISGTTTATSFSAFQGTGAARINLTGVLTGTFTKTITFTASAVTERSFYLRNASAGKTDITSITLMEDNGWIQPNILYLSGTVGIRQTSSVNCDAIGEWFWNNATDDLYVYSNTNPSGNVELGQRKKIVDVGDKQYITLKNLTVQHSNEANSLSTGYDRKMGAVVSSGGKNITVTGCTIQKNGCYGVYIQNSSYLTFDDNTIERSGETNGYGYNIYFNSTLERGLTNVTVTNNNINYAGWYGIYFRGDSIHKRPTNAIFSGNNFKFNTGTGLYLATADSVVAFNNYFYRNGSSTNTAEDYQIALACADNTDIYNNTLIDQLNNDAIQIYSDTDPTNGSSHNVRIFNNVIDSVSNGSCINAIQFGNLSMNNLRIFNNLLTNATGSTPRSGIQTSHNGVGTPDTVYVYNNTIVSNNHGITQYTNKRPMVMKNNLFANNTLQQVNMFQIASGLVHTNNLYYKTTGASLQYNGATYDTSGEITTFEASAITTDPLFVGTGTHPYSLQTGSPAINAGVNVGLTTDILGNTVPSGEGYDIGAYERQQ